METAGIIYLVRHCATANDESNYPVMLGQKQDADLSVRGRAHAHQLAEYLASKGIAAVYSSPLDRALQTATIIMRRVEKPLTFCSSLREADMGEWEGRTHEDVFAADPDRRLAFERDPATYGYPGGENLVDVCRRGLQCVETLATKHHDDRIVVVTHKYVLRAVLVHLMGLPMTRLREIDQDPGCVNVIRVFRGVMELQAVNYTSNTGPEEQEDDECSLHSSILA